VLTGLPVLTAFLPDSLVSMLAVICGWGASLSGLLALYFMYRIYRIKARPFWDHWQVMTSFYGNMLSLGALLAGLVSGYLFIKDGLDIVPMWQSLGTLILAGLTMETIGLWFHARDLKKQGGEAETSHFIQTRDFGKTYIARNSGLIISMLLVAALILSGLDGYSALILWGATALLITLTALVGRALFYALVVPTTMPGAFFWKNPGFIEHAKEVGLADMPQTGVLADSH